METGPEAFGPFPIGPAWRKRGPLADQGALDPALKPARPVEPEGTTAPAPPAAGGGGATAEGAAGVAPAAPGEQAAPPLAEPAFARRSAQAKAAPVTNPPAAVDAPPRRRRRMRTEGLIAYLSAAVALIALGGAIYLDQRNQAQLAELSGQVAALKSAVDALPVTMKGSAALAEPAAQPNDGTIDALLALQKRIAALEETARAATAPVAPTAVAALPGAGASMPATDATTAVDPQTTGAVTADSQPGFVGKTKLADGPVKDCIPIGTRFLAMAGDNYPICRTTAVIKVQTVTMEGVLLSNGKMVLAGETGPVGFGTCALNVVTTDMDGFADLKVTCT